MRRYTENDADNSRWLEFEFRPGDVVISAPSKSGTTWTQLLVALLVFDGPNLPQPLSRMSPWLDQLTRPVSETFGMLAGQAHRRFIKTHTPLDGVPMRDDVFYVCVGRDIRDAAVSMVHHVTNMDPEAFRAIVAAAKQADGIEVEPPSQPVPDRPPLDQRIEEYFDRFIDEAWATPDEPDWTLEFLAHHYGTFWERRDDPNVELFHFADYLTDLPGEIRRLGAFLGIETDGDRAERLAAEAHIDRVRDRATDVAPEAHMGFWKDPTGFFRSGAAGEWQTVMTPDQRERYAQRVADLFEPQLATWVHRPL